MTVEKMNLDQIALKIMESKNFPEFEVIQQMILLDTEEYELLKVMVKDMYEKQS